MTDDRHALNAIARALNPHWPEGHRGTYHPHELADLVTQRAATILEQSARIAELEAELSDWNAVVGADGDTPFDKLKRALQHSVDVCRKSRELESERDAVRKALVAWVEELRESPVGRDIARELEARVPALLAAAREGGAL